MPFLMDEEQSILTYWLVYRLIWRNLATTTLALPCRDQSYQDSCKGQRYEHLLKLALQLSYWYVPRIFG